MADPGVTHTTQRKVGTNRLTTALVAGALLLAAVNQPTLAEEAKPAWNALSAQQQQALAPLRVDWQSLDATRKQKWLAVASSFNGLPAEERARIQQRMATWVRLQPSERSNARQHFQESRTYSDDELQSRWLEYLALPPEQRQQLADQGQQRLHAAPALTQIPADPVQGLRAKTRVLPLNTQAPSPTVAPATVQARPGATTTSLTKPAQPASFQQPGLPKIAATPTFVDPTTLLPRRGAQAAATASRKASSADSDADQ